MFIKQYIRTVYGPHPHECFNTSLFIDPILPPKRCIYDCVYCPLGRTLHKTLTPTITVDHEKMIKDYREFIDENGYVFKNIVIWGYGDPLLNYQTPLFVNYVKEDLRRDNIDVKILLRTPGYNLHGEWVKPMYEYLDEIIIPLNSTGSNWRVLMDPPDNLKLIDLFNTLKKLDRRHRKIISIEYTLLRFNELNNYSFEQVMELISICKNIGIEKVYLTTIYRPGSRIGVKHVHGKVFDEIAEKIEDEGLEVVKCSYNASYIRVKAGVEKWLINHILRFPLTTSEINAIYGDDGLNLVIKLQSSGLIKKINWDNKIYHTIQL